MLEYNLIQQVSKLADSWIPNHVFDGMLYTRVYENFPSIFFGFTHKLLLIASTFTSVRQNRTKYPIRILT